MGRSSARAAPGEQLTLAQIAAHDRQRELGSDGDRQLSRLFGVVYPAGGLIADAGGGTGLATPLLCAAGLRVVLVDISASMLAAASWPFRVSGPTYARCPCRGAASMVYTPLM
jgi:SAM-dependent methyltransferase